MNRVNGHFYAGSTTNFRKRVSKHRRDLERGVHHCRPLQMAYDRQGPDAFTFSVVVAVRPDKLRDAEQDLLDRIFRQYSRTSI